MKVLKFVGSTLKDLRNFPENAKREAGYQLDQVQRGSNPDDWKPITSIGSGVREIRIHELNEYRVIYVANIGDEVYVLHAFEKKTQKTERKDIEVARRRFKEIIHG
jgi:phage-related protein